MIVTIQNADNKLLFLIQRRVRCSLLDRVMPVITSLGTCGVIWGVVMLVFLRMMKYRRIGLILFVTLIFCAVITNAVIKPLVARPRPCHVFTNIRLLIARPLDFSFPSGHTMSSFAAATIIVHANQTLGIIAFVLAVLISFSRLYLFVHYPSDVLAGTAFGVTIACVMLLIFHH
jgi:undecaprenyl-diphosphatase